MRVEVEVHNGLQAVALDDGRVMVMVARVMAAGAAECWGRSLARMGEQQMTVSGTMCHVAPEQTSNSPGDADAVAFANDEAARRGDAPTLAPHRHSITEAA